MKLLERITVEPGKYGGRPSIRSLRIRVADARTFGLPWEDGEGLLRKPGFAPRGKWWLPDL